MKSATKWCLACLASALTMCLFADSAIWQNVSDSSSDWTTLNNWKDASGSPVGAVPSTISDTAAFLPLSIIGPQTIDWAVTATGRTRQELALAALDEGNPYSRRTIQVGTKDYASTYELGAWLTLANPNGFFGYFSSSAGRFGIKLPATGNFVPVLANVSGGKRIDIEVPTAQTKAVVESMYEGGSLAKYGAGELEIKATTGADSILHVSQGSLILRGRAAADENDDLPVPGAWLHLDANRTDTMEYAEGAGGLLFVTKWSDVRGGADAPYFYFDSNYVCPGSGYVPTGKSSAPYLNSAIAQGKTVMDFGFQGDDPAALPDLTNCYMRLSKSQTGIREIFCAVMRRTGTTSASVFGDYDYGNYPFHRDGNKITYVNAGDPAKAVAYGDIMVDGVRGSNDSSWPLNSLGVIGIGTTNGIALGTLCSDRRLATRTGGWIIAEVVFFTNTLTHADRMLVSRYLQHKWTIGDGVECFCDAGAVTLAPNGTSLGVPEGRSAAVREVTAADGTLVKTGGGSLTIGSLSSVKKDGSVDIDIQGGAVSFGRLDSVSCDAPAANPFLWFDADATDRMTFTPKDGDDTEYVTVWKDCRETQNSFYAKTANNRTEYVDGAWPFLLRNAVNGHNVMDFGDCGYKTATAAFMEFQNLSDNFCAYEGFIVQNCKSAAAIQGSVFGGISDTSFYKSGKTTQLLLEDDGNYRSRNAVWTFNGAIVDPIQPGEAPFAVGDFNVISVSAASKLPFKFLGAKDRVYTTTTYGGVQMGELILYNRRLTDAERRQTIAYLMKRWRNELPAMARKADIGKMTFASDVPAVIDNKTDLSLAEVEMSGSTLTKRGSGVFSLKKPLQQQGIASITVESGTVDASGDPIGDILKKTAFHFDASDLKSLTYTVTSDNGTVQTNVSKVADQNPGGIVLYADAGGHSKANPTLKTVETAEGVKMPVFDFGHFNGDDAAAFNFSTRFVENVRELHTIYADAYDSVSQVVFGDSQYTMNYFRGANSNGKIIETYYSQTHRVRDGYFALDGVEALATSVLPAGFNLVSSVPTDVVSVGTVGRDRDASAGGCQVGELIGFTEALSAQERSYLQKRLLAKWRGGQVPIWTNELSSVTVLAGASIDFGDCRALAVSDLTGAGSIDADTVEVSSSLSFVAGDPMTIEGTFVQKGGLEVRVSIANDRLNGDYPILKASSFEGLNLATWQLVSAIRPTKTASFVFNDNTVFLRIASKGMAISIK